MYGIRTVARALLPLLGIYSPLFWRYCKYLNPSNIGAPCPFPSISAPLGALVLRK